MDALFESLGSAGAKHFLRTSLPYIQQNHADLLAAVSAQDWSTAVYCAHVLKGTAALYATEELLSLLDKITNKDYEIIHSKPFIEMLKNAIESTELRIKTYLS